MEGNHLLEKLTKKIREAREKKDKNVQIFLGAGVTIYLTKDPNLSWINLLDSGLTKIEKIYYPNAENNIEAIQKINIFRSDLSNQKTSLNKLLEIADFIHDEFTNYGEWPESEHYQDWLERTFGSLKVHKDRKDMLESLKFAFDCKAKLITTNYDRLISNNDIIDCIQCDVSQIDNFNAIDPAILHIHGDYKKPESVILGKKSYNSYFKDNAEYKEQLLQLFNPKQNINIFVGYGLGLNDPNFEVFLGAYESAVCEEQGREVETYILVKEDEEEELRKSFQSEKLKNNYQFITFEDHKELPGIIREIFDYPDPLKVFKPFFDKLYQALKKSSSKPKNIKLTSEAMLEFNNLLYLGSRIAIFANLMRLSRYALFSNISNDGPFKDSIKCIKLVNQFIDIYNAEKKRNGINNDDIIHPFFKFKTNEEFDNIIEKTTKKFPSQYPGIEQLLSDLAGSKDRFEESKRPHITSEVFIRLLETFARMMQMLNNLENMTLNYSEDRYNSFQFLQMIRFLINDLIIFNLKFNKYLIKLNYAYA